MSSNKSHTKNSNKGIYISIIVVLTVIAGIWIWKDIQLNNLKNESESQALEMKQQFKQQILETQSQDLRSIIKPLVWAVRSEMLKTNSTDLNFYINELVKEKGFQFILIVDDKNLVLSSTNKKWEGNPFEATGIAADLTTDSTIVKTVNDNLILASAPIMGFNKRLGTVVISFNVTPLTNN